MLDNVFVDTNIFLYAKFDDGDTKFKKANALLDIILQNDQVFISTQVINEFCVNAIRKGGDPDEIRTTALNFGDIMNIVPVTMNTVRESFRICRDYQFSHWDCVIIAAALEAKCCTLYTEDLTDGQIIYKTLKLVNPFLH